jgi:hypothetical protein
MMQSGAVLCEPGVQGMVGLEGLDKLQVRVPQVKMRQAQGAVVHHLAVQHGKPDAVAPDF